MTLVNGREVNRGSFLVEIPISEEILLRVDAVGYLPADLIIRPHLIPNRSRVLTAPIWLKPIPNDSTVSEAHAMNRQCGLGDHLQRGW